MITLMRLREAINAIDHKHDDREVMVWLPGGYIGLKDDKPFVSAKGILLEGNLKSGSALGSDYGKLHDPNSYD